MCSKNVNFKTDLENNSDFISPMKEKYFDKKFDNKIFKNEKSIEEEEEFGAIDFGKKQYGDFEMIEISIKEEKNVGGSDTEEDIKIRDCILDEEFDEGNFMSENLKNFDAEICSSINLKEEEEESSIQLNESDSMITETKKSQTIQCNYCSEFISKHSLKQHINEVHLNLKPFKCLECDFMTYKKNDLERHINTVHLKLFQFSCSQCKYKANRKDSLNRHIHNVHSNPTVFECLQCEFKTNKRLTLSKHVKKIHLLIHQFKCDNCDYETELKSHLKTHIHAVHLKLKSFQCDKCDYKTNQKSHLVRHSKNH